MGKALNDMMNRQGLENYEPELLEPTLLCDTKGNLNPLGIGWSRKPIHNCNLSGHWPRKKKWNYWNIVSNKYLFCAAITNFDYAAMAFTYLYNLETNTIVEKTGVIPLARGCDMSDNVREDVHFKSKNISLSFIEEKGFKKIFVEWRNFKDNMTLDGEFIIEQRSNIETLNVVIPWDKRRFQFTSKQNCLPALGTLTIGGETFLFNEGEALASLDFGRGVWPRRTFWNWATCSGIHEEKSIGLNLGGGWTDGTGMTENAILFNGKVNKISEDVIFDYNRDNIMKPWRIKTRNSSRVNMEFIPLYDRVANTNFPFIKSNMHQVFGRFTGRVVLDNEEEIAIENILGCAEEHYAIW